MTTEQAIKEIQELERKLKIATAALNYIGILQMGSMDYTEDFFEITKQVVRDTLKEI
jgi:hypothetical protein